MNYEKICNEVISIAAEVAQYIAGEAKKFDPSCVEIKGKNNFVSFVDKTSESLLVKHLSSLIPGAGFLAEEGTGISNREIYQWIIDPLDGTTNFIHGAPPYAISIGLKYEQRIVVGVVYVVTSEECFYTWEHAPSFLNGSPIHVSEVKRVQDSLIATGFPYTDYTLLSQSLRFLEYLFTASHGVRRLGSAAADLAYVACGRYDVFYEYGLHPWDVAAGSLIVQHAGGTVTDFYDGNHYLFGKTIVASNGKVHEDFLRLIQQFFPSSSNKI